MKAKKKAKAPKPVAAWAVTDSKGRLYTSVANAGTPRLWPTRRDAAIHVGGLRDATPVKVLVTVAPAPRRTAK